MPYHAPMRTERSQGEATDPYPEAERGCTAHLIVGCGVTCLSRPALRSIIAAVAKAMGLDLDELNSDFGRFSVSWIRANGHERVSQQSTQSFT